MGRSFLVLGVISLLLFSACSIFRYDQELLLPDRVSQRALEIALTKEGRPYVWGGRGPNVFDCSGLITWSYKKALGRDEIFRIGHWIYPDATMHDLYQWNVEMIPLERALPGDIVFISNEHDRMSHGGFFVEQLDENNIKILHASSSHGRVLVERWPVEGIKLNHWFVGIGRLVIAQ